MGEVETSGEEKEGRGDEEGEEGGKGCGFLGWVKVEESASGLRDI